MVLPYIDMNLPQVYMCSPSWTLLPPPSPSHPSGSSQCTSPSTLYHASSLNWRSVSHMIIYRLGRVFLFSTFFKIFSAFGFLQFEYDMPRCVFFFFSFWHLYCLVLSELPRCDDLSLILEKSQLLLLQILPLFLFSFFALCSPIIHVIPFVIVPQWLEDILFHVLLIFSLHFSSGGSTDKSTNSLILIPALSNHLIGPLNIFFISLQFFILLFPLYSF